MARDDGEQQAMTSERLMELKSFVSLVQRMIEEEWTVTGTFGDDGIIQAQKDAEAIGAVLAEVERLRAVITAKEKREAALVDMLQRLIRDADATYVDVRPYAGLGHTKIVGPFPNTLEQARAVLASTESSERSGGDGA